MRRGRGSVIMVAAVAMLALGAGAPVAGASIHSATPGWRVVKVYTHCDTGSLQAITATGPSDAWATGNFSAGCDVGTPLLIARWDGRSWQSLRPPRQFADAGATAAAALSRRYSWTFVEDLSGQGAALLWQNGRWHSFRMPKGAIVQSAAAFSRSDAWAFSGFFPFAARFNGHAWRRVPVPVSAEATGTVGPRSIWAVGRLAPSKTQPTPPPFALAHWTGRWRTIAFPKPKLPPSATIFSAWVVPDDSVGAWVLAAASSVQTETEYGLLLHWTGSRWRQVRIPFMSNGTGNSVGPLARDGNGGVWVATYPQPYHGCFCQELAMVHYSSAGIWTRKFVPISFANIASMRLIPGTKSIWAAGSARDFATILKYGP